VRPKGSTHGWQSVLESEVSVNISGLNPNFLFAQLSRGTDGVLDSMRTDSIRQLGPVMLCYGIDGLRSD
jgi:hypothetical protein